MDKIFHIAKIRDWDEARDKGSYAPGDFSEIGFIHCCYRQQLSGVIERYFLGQGDFILLTISKDEIKETCRDEISTGGEFFPHVYSRIPLSAILNVEKVTC